MPWRAGCARAGLVAGDRVGILSLNRVEFVATLLGCMRAGVVPVPINIKLTADTVGSYWRTPARKMVFTEPGSLQALPCRRARSSNTVGVTHARIDAFVDRGDFTAFEPAPDSIAVQPYTSGSTGRPERRAAHALRAELEPPDTRHGRAARPSKT